MAANNNQNQEEGYGRSRKRLTESNHQNHPRACLHQSSYSTRNSLLDLLHPFPLMLPPDLSLALTLSRPLSPACLPCCHYLDPFMVSRATYDVTHLLPPQRQQYHLLVANLPKSLNPPNVKPIAFRSLCLHTLPVVVPVAIHR